MAVRSLQMQESDSMNMQQQLNLTLYTTPPFLDGFTTESWYSDLSLDDTIEGAAADNYSDLYCPSFASHNPNITYLNVSCDTALDFSVPLYGEQ